VPLKNDKTSNIYEGFLTRFVLEGDQAQGRRYWFPMTDQVLSGESAIRSSEEPGHGRLLAFCHLVGRSARAI
jgi:hypothetical protein